MKERPILFSAPMVRAILDGRKTQTRRLVKPQPMVLQPIDSTCLNCDWRSWVWREGNSVPEGMISWCPYGRPGTVLLVKESAWMWCERRPNGKTPTGRPKWHYVPMREAPILYAADHPKRPETSVVSPDTGNVWGWRLKIGRFLPAWAVRIRLVSTMVRVERLNEITEEDAIAEGVEQVGDLWRNYTPLSNNIEYQTLESPIDSFRSLWESINGPGSWDANPWVWVIEFRRVKP